MFSIIDRYLLGETLKGMATILAVLIGILVSNVFISNLRRVAAGSVTNEVVTQLLGLEVLRLLGLLIPAAFFFSILYTLGRMYREGEMTALAASGVSTLRIYRAFLYSTVPLTLLVGWLTLDILPATNRTIDEIRYEQKTLVNLAGLAAGRFNEFEKGDLVFYVESVSQDQQTMHNIFVQNRQHGKLGIITAEKGYRYTDENGAHYVVLTHGHRYEGVPGEAEYSVGRFDKYALRITLKPEKPTDVRRKARSSRDLWNSSEVEDRAELQYRLAFPLAVIIFTLISVPLSRSFPRQGVYGRLFLAFLAYAAFFSLLGVSGEWMTSGVTPPWLGIWWVHLILFIPVVPLVLRDNARSARLMRRLAGRGAT